MKILIIGEFSSFARHLKNGFMGLGHDVTIIMKPDSFKKFKSDKNDVLYGYNLPLLGHPVKGSARLLTLYWSFRIWLKLRTYHKDAPDLIFVINSCFLSLDTLHSGVSIRFVEKQLTRGSKLIMSECGVTPADYYNNTDFWVKKGHQVKFEDRKYSFLLEKSHAIIPTCYTYYDNLMKYANYYRYDTGRVCHAIPLPITINKNCKIISCVNRRVVIFHGIIRPEEKGTPYILEAMKRLQEEMPERVECVCRGGIPYDEYIKLFDRVDILVDQTYGNGWGMNAMIGAMNGKCVLAPCGKENSENMGIQNIPFVQIGPDSTQIYNVLKELVLNPERIDAIKLASRQFAEEYCDSKIIAKRYLELVGLAQ